MERTMSKKIPVLIAAALVLAPPALGAGVGSGASIRGTGRVTAVAATSLTVAADTGQSMVFRLVATTAYELDGQPASQSALQAGQRVEVKYHVEADGSLKAKAVKIKTPAHGSAPAPVRVSGAVVSVTSATLVASDSRSG